MIWPIHRLEADTIASVNCDSVHVDPYASPSEPLPRAPQPLSLQSMKSQLTLAYEDN
jgi:hypothetical protein